MDPELAEILEHHMRLGHSADTALSEIIYRSFGTDHMEQARAWLAGYEFAIESTKHGMEATPHV